MLQKTGEWVAATLPRECLLPDGMLPLPTFDVSIVGQDTFMIGCEAGLEDFARFHQRKSAGRVVLAAPVSMSAMVQFILNTLGRPAIEPDSEEEAAFPYRVGYIFGWLSALSVHHPALAEQGVSLLVALVASLCSLFPLSAC